MWWRSIEKLKKNRSEEVLKSWRRSEEVLKKKWKSIEEVLKKKWRSIEEVLKKWRSIEVWKNQGVEELRCWRIQLLKN